MNRSSRPLALAGPIGLLLLASCATTTDEQVGESSEFLTTSQRMPRYDRIKSIAAAHGLRSKAFLLAGIARHESGMAMCWSEATQHCKGPPSPDCGNGPVLAGSGDGDCSLQQGGLGMFQFDAGTYLQTTNSYGPAIVSVDGQVKAAVDFAVRIVKISAYTRNAETDAKALAWINDFDIDNAGLRDQWVRTVLRYYNGCPEGGSCWAPRYQMYNDAITQVLADTGGTGYWGAGGASGGACAGYDAAAPGAINDHYRELGACGSELGAPVSAELAARDGRYRVFERGSIYWTARTGAHAVQGRIRDAWKTLGWETGTLGYPLTDEEKAPDGVGRYSVFEGGSVYWTPQTDAHAVFGRIRDAWKQSGWEAGPLGYPTADEVAVAGGRKSEFQHGDITWTAATDTTRVNGH
ncbi:hypothetical protein BH11MYX4_BH11MYX4_18590 [soil metagenome]